MQKLVKTEMPVLWHILHDMSQPTKAMFWPCLVSFFSVGMHYTRIFRNQRVANSSASKLQPAMVDISYRCQITYQEEKPVSIAADLVEEHQGQKFLKISATNYAICQLVCGGKLPTKNPSLAKSKELQALVQARNDKIQEYLAAPEETQELFDSEMPKNKCTKKRKAQAMEEPGDKFVVTILLGSTEIPCLVGGQRPTKWDLFVAMETEPLREVIYHLRAGCQIAFAQPSRSYKATKKESSHRWP